MRAILPALLIALAVSTASAATPTPTSTTLPADQDAALVYDRAAAMIRKFTPSSGDMEWDYFSPPPKVWREMTAAAWKENQPAYALVRKARSLDRGNWPVGNDDDAQNRRLNSLRLLACSLCDVAHYRHLEHDEAEAIELLRDVLHLSDVLRNSPPKEFASPELGERPLLVSIGIDCLAMARLDEIVADVQLSNDKADKHALSIDNARTLIKQLLDRQRVEPNDLLRAALGEARYVDAYGKNGPPPRSRIPEVINRSRMELSLAAMSLACHLYRFDHKQWPPSPDALVPAYLPRVPLDPWGDGKQTYGYALVKNALPDGSERPLVYARCESKDGLQYRVDGPFYSFYTGDGSNRPRAAIQYAGQFRDVARWSPTQNLPTDDRPHLRRLETKPSPGL